MEDVVKKQFISAYCRVVVYYNLYLKAIDCSDKKSYLAMYNEFQKELGAYQNILVLSNLQHELPALRAAGIELSKTYYN